MISEEDFVQQIKQISSYPANKDEWVLKESSPEANTLPYLIKRNHKMSCDHDIYNIEVHIVRHSSYCVPVLCFDAWRSDGTPIREYDTIWSLFSSKLSGDYLKSTDMFSTLTQIDHPVHQTPIWALHPCKTPYILESVSSSSNVVLSFMSIFCPFLGINVDHLMSMLD